MNTIMLKKLVSLANNQDGFTLIEVLIAIFILAIGLLGLANLQTLSIHNNHSAYLRTQATWLAYDIIHRMRSNMVLQSFTDTVVTTTGTQNYTTRYYVDNYDNQTTDSCKDPIKDKPDCINQNCDQTSMRLYDICEWAAAIDETLPGGGGKVCVGGINPDTLACTGIGNGGIQGITPYVVAIWWNEPAQPDNRELFLTTFQIAQMPDHVGAYLQQKGIPIP